MNICVVGAGAIGGWIAARLALAGGDVSVVARGETLRLVESEGLRLDEAGHLHCVAVEASDDPRQFGTQDLLFIAVKAPSLPDLAPSLRPLVGAETVIVPVLNGVPWWFTDEPLRSVDPDRRIAHALPFEQVVGCVVHASCHRSAPNRVALAHADKLTVGEPGGGMSDRVERLQQLIGNTGIRCEVTNDVRRRIWYKLWGNATLNPLSALTRSTADKLLNDPPIRALMIQAMDELAAVGAAIGHPIDETAEDRMEVTARLGAFKSSMLQDVEAGRPIELEALVGAPREIARRVGVPSPHLDLIYAMTRLMADNLGLA
jgi:2-dehydropantoate 2-reductase